MADAHARDWPLLAFLVALPLGLLARIAAGWQLPLWFDEAFTGTIAAEPDLAHLVRWCLSELTGPAFYGPMWLWAKVAGTSDAALRAPALALSIATPLMVARWGHPDRSVRLLWAALLLLWLPVLPTASEARPYPQLLFLCTLQAIVFMRFLREPRAALATAWSTVAAAALLTHYYAMGIVGLQAVAIIVRQRRALWSLRLATVPLALAAVWIAFHFSFLLGFAQGRMATYAPLPSTALLLFPTWLLGDGLQGFGILAVLAATGTHWWRSARSSSPEAQLVWIGVVASALLIVSGAFRATIMPRYFTPAIPALLLGLALWCRRLRIAFPAAPLLLFALFVPPMAATSLAGPRDVRFVERRHFEFETASAWLLERRPARLHFLWSTPTGAMSGSDNLAQVAGFFFRRSGRAVDVLVQRGRGDYNRLLAEGAGSDPAAAILWVSDNDLPRGISAAIGQQYRDWECRDFGGEGMLVYACRRPAIGVAPAA